MKIHMNKCSFIIHKCAHTKWGHISFNPRRTGEGDYFSPLPFFNTIPQKRKRISYPNFRYLSRSESVILAGVGVGVRVRVSKIFGLRLRHVVGVDFLGTDNTLIDKIDNSIDTKM